MKTAVVASMCVLLCGALHAASTTIDLRTPQASRKGLSVQSGPSGSCLRSATLGAGAAASAPLSVGDELNFLLFDGVEISVRLAKRMESPLGGEAFLGEVSGYAGVKNAVVLQTEEGLTVDIQDFENSRVYTIVSTADGVTVKEIDPSLDVVTPTEPVDPGLPAGGSKLQSLSSFGVMSDQSSTIVDVLVAYDTPAAAWARQNGGGITNFATMAVQKMNTALENCGLSTNFRYRLVGVIAVQAEGGTDFNGVLDATRSGTGSWAPIKAMRDEVGADIVSTFIDTGSASGTTGLGYSLKNTQISSFSEWAYNVCAVRAISSSHTMTHEVGHNIGAGHASAVDPAQISPGPQLYSYSAGHYFTGSDGVKYHTIMAYYYDGFGNTYTAVPYFSSPDIVYKGTPVGDATHDNVRTIRDTYLAASEWRDQVIPMSYDVYFSPGDGATFTDSITVTLTPGKAGLQIRYTLDGSTPTASSTLYTAPITLTQTTTIRAVTVTDGVAGPVFEATYSVSDLGNGVDAPQLSWRASDSVPWAFQTTNTYDGVDAVQVQDNGEYSYESWLETVVTGPTQMSFRYKMRTGNGSFSVKIDGTTQFDDTRSSVSSDDWHLAEVQVPAGSHTVRFVFANKNSRYNGYNGAWLDTVLFDVLSRPPTISPATTDSESTATTFQGSLAVTLAPPSGKSGFLYYTIDGSDPAGETALVYDGPITLTKSTRVRAVFVEGGKDPSVEVGGLYLERHPITAGEWTTDVEGAKSAAAQDGRLIAVLFANIETCSWCRKLDPIAESPEFLAWAKANGIYLVTADISRYVDAQTAYSWFWDLCEAYTGVRSSGYPQMYFVRPLSPNVPIDQGLARNDGESVIGTEPYLDTVESLVAGFASVLDETPPQAPVCSQDDDLVADFPISVTLSNPNGSGTIYYTLDGSVPTRTSGIAYSGAIEIASSAVELRAAVWTEAALSSPVLVKKYRSVSEWINGVFGSSGITWHKSGSVDWYQVGSEPTLRTGGLMGSDTYTSTVTATVSGKGKLVYRYKAASWSNKNVISAKINGATSWTVKANYTSMPTVTITNTVNNAGTTTFEWTYTVNDPANDLSSIYSSGGISVWSGVWLYDLQWIPEMQAVEIEGVSVPYTWLDNAYPGQGGSVAAYEALALSDTDGDGYLAWQEYLLDTDPNDADSRLFATVRIVDGLPVFGWSHTNANISAQGFRYAPKGRVSLDDSSGWQPYTTGHRFFKVVVEPAD